MPGVPADLVRSLYEAPPEGFVAARTAAVAAARKAGDQAAAKQIAALRKPTVAAWLVNLLALRAPDLVDELVALSAALRSAQRNLQGEKLRELSGQRRQAVSALVGQARKLAVEAEPGLSAGKLPLADVESTLTAALADAEVAALVRTGRLVRTVTYDGFGEVPKPRLRLLTDADLPEPGDAAPEEPEDDEPPATATATATATPDRAAERRRAEAERRRAAALKSAEREIAAAETAVQNAEARAVEADQAERDALERRRAAAQADVSRLKKEHKVAQRDAAVARRRLGDAHATRDDLLPG
jgi:hypothetical protein